jgi:hypothetical protein
VAVVGAYRPGGGNGYGGRPSQLEVVLAMEVVVLAIQEVAILVDTMEGVRVELMSDIRRRIETHTP